jgi:hypothetical protein
MQRVYEIQSSWDERKKLRHFALRPPITPPYPYTAPVYSPNLLSVYGRPSNDGTRQMVTTANNPGSEGYSYSFIEKGGRGIDNSNRNNNDLNIRQKNHHKNSNLKNIQKILEVELEKTKLEIETFKKNKFKVNNNETNKTYPKNRTEIILELASNSNLNANKTNFNIEKLDYEKISEEIYNGFSKIKNNVDKDIILKVQF